MEVEAPDEALVRGDEELLRLAVDNLLDETYYERSSYIERNLGARYVYPLYAPGRTVSLGVNMKF